MEFNRNMFSFELVYFLTESGKCDYYLSHCLSADDAQMKVFTFFKFAGCAASLEC